MSSSTGTTQKSKTYGVSDTATKKPVHAPDLPYRPPTPRGYRPPIGLIGCGGITQSHLRAYKAAGYRVVAMTDLRQDMAQKRREEFYPDAVICSDHHELLRRDDIEVVDIATHPAERVALIEDALRARKHVLSQKPFVLDLDTGERLAALADQQGMKLAVNQNGRWAPHFSYIRQAIARGVIGQVMSAHLGVHWDHGWTAGTPFDKIHHLVLYDFAIHWFDIVTQFMGVRTARRVYASLTHAPLQKPKPPLLAQVLIEYDHAQATLVFDASVPCGPLDHTFVAGTKGTLHSTGPNLGTQRMTLTTPDGAAEPVLEGTWFTSGFQGTMAELLCAIEDDREPNNSARSNLRSLALCFAAIRSADSGVPQSPGSVRSYASA